MTGVGGADEPAMRVEDVRIEMRDGIRLAATLYMPSDDRHGRVPALLEYLPYRKDDGTLGRDFDLYSLVVPNGYVGARVDIRGTGASEGSPPDFEYSEEEQRDGEDVIAWLAAQPWCNGNVGMWGISWGGFNSIHMAMRRPPALKAIVAVDASDDLFHDDIHYIDGMLHIDQYEQFVDLETALTPAPEFPLDEDVLGPRFDHAPWLLVKLRHQREDDFWRRGSLRPGYDRLRVPALLIGGLLDGYRDSVIRMIRAVPAPTRSIIGPWNHAYPHDAVPGPTIEWRDEVLRWWKHWLKGEDSGLLVEPAHRFYVRASHPPRLDMPQIPGRWRAEESWPLAGARSLALELGADHSLAPRGRRGAHHLRYVASTGVEAGMWWGELTPDQAPLDAASLVYDSPPLDEPIVVLGIPRVVLFGASDAPLANWFARLSDVAPEGAVALVTGGGLNAAQRRSPAHPSPAEPGAIERLEFDLHATSWTFDPGHRIRLAVSNSMWPMIWPTPHRMTTTLSLGGERASTLTLPVVPFHGATASFPAATPFRPSPGVTVEGEVFPGTWVVRRDGSVVTADWHGATTTRFPWGIESRRERLVYRVDDDDPAVASVRGETDLSIERPSGALTWQASLQVESDASDLHYRYRRRLRRDGTLLREREWDETIPRDHH